MLFVKENFIPNKKESVSQTYPTTERGARQFPTDTLDKTFFGVHSEDARRGFSRYSRTSAKLLLPGNFTTKDTWFVRRNLEACCIDISPKHSV